MNESINQLSIYNLWGAVITVPVQMYSILLNMSPRQMNQILIVLGNLSNNTVYIELRVCMFACAYVCMYVCNSMRVCVRERVS